MKSEIEIDLGKAIQRDRRREFIKLFTQCQKKAHKEGWTPTALTDHMVRVSSSKFRKRAGTHNFALLQACMYLHQDVALNGKELGDALEDSYKYL